MCRKKSRVTNLQQLCWNFGGLEWGEELVQKVHGLGASRDRLWLVRGGRTGKTEEVEMFVRIRLNVRTEVGRMTLNEEWEKKMKQQGRQSKF